jgi:FtsP/CotA-like multicopper oxidase with cupredoxin domain
MVTGHPFHLHGHAFYVLRTHKARVGYGSYNPLNAAEVIPWDNVAEWDSGPRIKDTVYVPAKGHVVIRFQAQKGLWALHCHIMWHQATGMAMALDVV